MIYFTVAWILVLIILYKKKKNLPPEDPREGSLWSFFFFMFGGVVGAISMVTTFAVVLGLITGKVSTLGGVGGIVILIVTMWVCGQLVRPVEEKINPDHHCWMCE